MAARQIDPSIVAKCVPLWRECCKRATRRTERLENQCGRSEPLYAPDEVLREHGITFDRDRRLWASYERAIRKAVQ